MIAFLAGILVGALAATACAARTVAKNRKICAEEVQRNWRTREVYRGVVRRLLDRERFLRCTK